MKTVLLLSFLIIRPEGDPLFVGGATGVGDSGQMGSGRHGPVDEPVRGEFVIIF